jgi:hypothetical protein
VPDGAQFHVAWFDGGALNAIDLWESPEAFQSFQQSRLAAGIQEAGIQGEPEVQFHDAHAVFAPAVQNQ